ncbi:MAG: peptidase domain-containing ABC transporter [Planctomycetales bacterium]
MSTRDSTPRVSAEPAIWEPLARLLEQMFIESRHPVDRAAVRRAVQGAVSEWQGTTGDRWWKWVSESGISLGMRCRAVDGTPTELIELAETGVILVHWNEATQSWMGVSGTPGRLRTMAPETGPTAVGVRRQQAESMLRTRAHEDLIRCVAVEVVPVSQPSAHDDHSPWNRLWQLLRPERSDIGVLLVFAAFSSLLALATPLAVESLVNTVAFGRLVQPIVVLTLIVLLVLGFAAMLRALQTYVAEIIQQRLFARIAADIAWRLPRVPAEFRDQHDLSELVNRFFDVTTVQKSSALLLIDGFTLVLGTMIGMLVLAFYHPFLLAMDAVLLVLMALALTVLARGAVRTSIQESKCKYYLAGWLEELARCPLAFKSEGGTEVAQHRSDQLTTDYLIARQQHFRILMRQVVFTLALQALASTALLGLGGWLVMSGQLTLGQLVAAELIVTVIVGSFAKIGKYLESLYDLLAAVDKLGILFSLPTERSDGLLGLPAEESIAIDVRGVSFAYEAGYHGLDEFSLEVPRGERLALTGPAGSGKSTLIDLLYGLREPLAGYLTLSGIDPRDLRPDILRRRVVLARDVEVFGGSVAENVHLDRPDLSIQQVREALEEMDLLDDVLRLPEGLETPLSRDGQPLSETQAIRLMLARAAVSRPGLLLVDGLLDRLSDGDARRILLRLTDRRHPWTLVVSTGRDLIAKQCDRIVALTGHPSGRTSDDPHSQKAT